MKRITRRPSHIDASLLRPILDIDLTKASYRSLNEGRRNMFALARHTFRPDMPRSEGDGRLFQALSLREPARAVVGVPSSNSSSRSLIPRTSESVPYGVAPGTR